MRKLCMLTLISFAVAVGVMAYDCTPTGDTYTVSMTDGNAILAVPAVALIAAPAPALALLPDNAQAWEYDAPSANLILGDPVTDLGTVTALIMLWNEDNRGHYLDHAGNQLHIRYSCFYTFLSAPPLNRAVTDLVI